MCSSLFFFLFSTTSNQSYLFHFSMFSLFRFFFFEIAEDSRFSCNSISRLSILFGSCCVRCFGIGIVGKTTRSYLLPIMMRKRRRTSRGLWSFVIDIFIMSFYRINGPHRRARALHGTRLRPPRDPRKAPDIARPIRFTVVSVG